MLAKFWYSENGTGCVEHNEPCHATAATISEATPFLWQSELVSTSGITTGCLPNCYLAIPSISGRVLHYQLLYRDAAGVQITAGPEQIVSVP